MTDSNGQINGAIEFIIVTSEDFSNQAPVADFTFTPDASDSLTVDFDGSNSDDSDGSIIDYDWAFGDGSYFKGQIVRHTYETPGEYNVRLQVTDNQYKTTVIEKTVKTGDADQDGIFDVSDNCPETYNPDQADFDGDGVGDACDMDDDNDGVDDDQDVFPTDPDEWADSDNDTVGDNSDNCPNDYNPGQEDSDGDGIGDDCDNVFVLEGTKWIFRYDNNCSGTYIMSSIELCSDNSCIFGSDLCGWQTEGDQLIITTGDMMNRVIYTGTISDTMSEIIGTYNYYGQERCWNAILWIDSDGDGIPNEWDDCPDTYNMGLDVDRDGIDDACDPRVIELGGTSWACQYDMNCTGDYGSTKTWIFENNGGVYDSSGNSVGGWETEGEQLIVTTGDMMNRVIYTGVVNSSMTEFLGTYSQNPERCWRGVRES